MDCHDVALVIWKQQSQAEIRNLGLQILVQQNVAGLDVAVNDSGLGQRMQVMDAVSHSQAYVFTDGPAHIHVLFVLYTYNHVTNNIIQQRI